MNRLHELGTVVAANVIEDAIEIGELLARLGVPHALIGGLAVGLNGFPRATKGVEPIQNDANLRRLRSSFDHEETLAVGRTPFGRGFAVSPARNQGRSRSAPPTSHRRF